MFGKKKKQLEAQQTEAPVNALKNTREHMNALAANALAQTEPVAKFKALLTAKDEIWQVLESLVQDRDTEHDKIRKKEGKKTSLVYFGVTFSGIGALGAIVITTATPVVAAIAVPCGIGVLGGAISYLNGGSARAEKTASTSTLVNDIVQIQKEAETLYKKISSAVNEHVKTHTALLLKQPEIKDWIINNGTLREAFMERAFTSVPRAVDRDIDKGNVLPPPTKNR